MKQRISRIAVVMGALGVLSACGTTVPNAGSSHDQGSGLAGPGARTGPGASSGTATPQDGAGPAGGGGGGGTSGLPGTTTSGSAAAGTTTGGTSAGGVAGRGPLRLGLTATNIEAIAAVFGRDPKANNDPIVAARRVVAQINKQGGIAGRKIETVAFSADSAADADTNGQRACAALTEDTKVDIVVNLNMGSEVLVSCLRERGIAFVDSAEGIATDAVAMRQHPNWLLPTAMRFDRSSRASIEVAAQRRVLKRGDTLGVLVEDCPWGRRVYDDAIRPAAQRAGVKLVQGSTKCTKNLVEDLGPLTNDVQRETLRFSSARATHVMAVANAEAFVVSQFTQNASRQQYFPKYLVTSKAYPFGNSQEDAVVKISPDALPNMHGLGYSPLWDVGDQAKPVHAAQLAAQVRCKKADPTLMGTEAETESGRYFRRNLFYDICDALYVTKALYEANGGRTSVADVVRGYRTVLAGGLASALLGAGGFEAGGRLDGAGAARPFAYDSLKRGFSYVGPLIRIP